MHPIPALILAASILGSAIVVPDHGQSHVGVITERTLDSATEAEGDISIAPRAEEKAEVSKVEIKLTPDNSCGNKEAGKDRGFTCDAKLEHGGACCSTYVSPDIWYCVASS